MLRSVLTTHPRGAAALAGAKRSDRRVGRDAMSIGDFSLAEFAVQDEKNALE